MKRQVVSRSNPEHHLWLVKEVSVASGRTLRECFTTDGATRIFAGFGLKTPLFSVLPSNPLNKFVPANRQSLLRFALLWADPFASLSYR